MKKAIEYHNLDLKIAKEVGDKHGEGGAHGNLGNAYDSLGDFKKAIEYHNLHLKIAKEVGDKHGEGSAYGNLGNAYFSLGDFKKATEYHNHHENCCRCFIRLFFVFAFIFLWLYPFGCPCNYRPQYCNN